MFPAITAQSAYWTILIAAYAGALLSYAIVVSKSLGFPQLNRAYLQKAMMEDNAQYGFMAVYWFLSKPLYSMCALAQHICLTD